jgi:voltage-gated potassium channel
MSVKAGLFSKLRNSLVYMAVVFTISVAGYLVYGWNLIDSIYMVVITFFGVGFGEVHPIETVGGKVFTMCVIVGGTSSVVFVIGEVIRFVTEGEIVKAIGELKKSKQVDIISQHAIICGYGRIGQILAHELAASKFPFVVVDLDDERLALAEESGYLFVKGSATEEETLQRAHIERAVVLATVLPQDTLNVYITLTARNLNKHLRIIARGEQPSTEKKLRQAGADEVVLPASIGGTRIAHSITRPATMNFLGDNRGMISQDLKHLGVEIDELRLHKHTHLVGRTILELQAMSEGHLLVIALQRADGSVLRSGFLEEKLHAGDSVVIIGRVNALPPSIRGEVDREELL